MRNLAPSRNWARVAIWDAVVPVLGIAALLMIGVMLGWPVWWVSAGSMLCLLVVQAVAVNVVLFRRDSVTLGTDDDAPGLRLAAIGLCTAVLVATVAVGYARWTEPDRQFTRDSADVVRIAGDASVATASFTPMDPSGAIDRAVSLMAPDRADAFRGPLEKATADMAKRNITASAQVVSAGLEMLSPSVASVAVVLRGTQSTPGQPPVNSVLALRVSLSQHDGRWLVDDVQPINSR